MSDDTDKSNLPPPPSYEEAQKFVEPSSGGTIPGQPSGPPTGGTGPAPYPVGPAVAGYGQPYPGQPPYQGGMAPPQSGHMQPYPGAPPYQNMAGQPYPTQPYAPNMTYPAQYTGVQPNPYMYQGGVAPPAQGATAYPVAIGTATMYGPGSPQNLNRRKQLFLFFAVAGIMIVVFIIVVSTVSRS